MGYSYTGDALLRASFEIMVPQPLDNRTVVNSEQDLYTIPESSAYRGMTIANPDDGNIYMLVDKSQITSPLGWKSSGISIITCSQVDYQALLENTNLEDYTPIDNSKDYLRRDSYYYIPEEGDGTYLTSEWGSLIEEQLNSKATVSYVNQVQESLTLLSQKLAQEYSTTLNIQNTYATLELTYSIEQADEKFLTKEDAASTYNTQEEFNALQETLESDYVLKSDLKRPGMEDDDYFFITYNEYNQDKEAEAKEFNTELLKTSNIETQGISIQNIEEKEVVQGEETVIEKNLLSEAVLTTDKNKLLINGQEIALDSDVPVIEVLSQEEYDNIPEQDRDPKKYYYTYDPSGDINNGYITKEYIDSIIVNRSDIYGMITDITNPLTQRIETLESQISSISEALTALDVRLKALEPPTE